MSLPSETALVSGWVIPKLMQPRQENVGIAPYPRHPELWNEIAQEILIKEIAQLRDDWDGAGGSHIGVAAVGNATALLHELGPLDLSPQIILPNSSGTIQFDWKEPLGNAHLEIGNTTFGFYTEPHLGESIMKDGLIEVLNVEELAFALATIQTRDFALSLANWSNPLGIPAWVPRRAA